MISQVSVYTRTSTQNCWVYLDISSFSSKNKAVSTDSVKTFTFVPRNWNCGTFTIEYQVSYWPLSATPNLIYMPTAATPSIIFDQSNNIADAQSYAVSVCARITGTSACVSSTSVWYSYYDPYV